MAITPATDKIAIQSVLKIDPYLTEYLGFEPKEIYTAKATDALLDENKQQIFVYNSNPETTINPIVMGLTYEVDVSTPRGKSGTADLAIEQIIALLHNLEISKTHKLELLDGPVVLSSDTSLYQIGVRFVVYATIYNKKKTIT